MKYLITRTCILFFCLTAAIVTIAQPGSTIELKKPPKYENRQLRSEKTGDKKLTFSRRVYQDMVTHYNYYFNANVKLGLVISNAKAAFKDDYTEPLLPFYNYTLDVTAADNTDLDSVIYKCTEGVLLHDLRNDWIDDMYLLLGKAYFYRKNFDSSLNCFRYINYAFAKKDDGYDIPIGSNASNNNGQFSIATPDEQSFFKRITSRPPARNEALLWLSRNYVETDQLSAASGLLEIIRHDPDFPERLQTNLNELLSYLFYKENDYDSSAFYLSKSLKNAADKFEESRWEFLIAQLYQLSGNNDKALAYYTRCINTTPDPVMEVYANLNSINLNTGNKETILQQKLNALLKLSKKDKYAEHRDIIYYAAAQIAIQLQDKKMAAQLLQKSVKSSVNDAQQKNKSFLLLADITYDNKSYIAASNFYDSVQTDQLSKQADKDHAELRRTALKTIAENLTIIHIEDSLQKVAAMPEAERDALIKKIVKQQMKLHGIKDSGESNINPAVQLQTASNLFPTSSGNQSNNNSGNWYFNNTSLKSGGFTEFKQKWGNRPNTDNWQRKAAISNTAAANNVDSTDEDNEADSSLSANAANKPDYSSKTSMYNLLAGNIPLTEEKIKISNGNISKALLDNGTVFQNQLEDYDAALDSYNELNRRFGKDTNTEQALFNQYYCYTKLGNKSSADSCRDILNKEFGKGKLAQQLNNQNTNTATNAEDPATKEYEHIYNLFIAGNFDEAKTEKAKADSLYGNSHWTPQLLFIESIYYVSKKEDSVAINKLNNLAAQFPSSPLAERAKTMIDVLKRRKEIESYLTSLQITKNVDEAGPVVTLRSTAPTVSNKPVAKADSVVNKKSTSAAAIKKDTIAAVPTLIKTFSFKPDEPQYVLIVLDSIDPVFANEARNAFNRYNLQNYYNQKMDISSVKLNDRYNLVLIGPFTNALGATDYVDKTKPIAGSRIIPWLTSDKFSYSIISQSNMDLLKDNKDIDGYRKILHNALPNEF